MATRPHLIIIANATIIIISSSSSSSTITTAALVSKRVLDLILVPINAAVHATIATEASH
jgi:hypothetical protein